MWFRFLPILTLAIWLGVPACALMDGPAVVEHRDALTGTKRTRTEYHWLSVTEGDYRLSLDIEKIKPVGKKQARYRLRLRLVSLNHKIARIRPGTSLKVRSDKTLLQFYTPAGGEELESSGYAHIYISTAYYNVNEYQLKQLSQAATNLVWVDASPQPVTGLFRQNKENVFRTFVSKYVR